MKFFLQAIAVVAAYSVTIARAAPVMPTITAWGVTSSANGVQQAPSVSQSIADLPASSLQYIADDGVRQAPSISKSIADLPASSLQYIADNGVRQAPNVLARALPICRPHHSSTSRTMACSRHRASPRALLTSRPHQSSTSRTMACSRHRASPRALLTSRPHHSSISSTMIINRHRAARALRMIMTAASRHRSGNTKMLTQRHRAPTLQAHSMTFLALQTRSIACPASSPALIMKENASLSRRRTH